MFGLGKGAQFFRNAFGEPSGASMEGMISKNEPIRTRNGNGSGRRPREGTVQLATLTKL